jgi:uncharacterized membrane protein YdjX (TVP38/TMEM64 family)
LKRWRAALPLVLLLLAGIVLFASGSLHALTPGQLVAHQAELHEQIVRHPWLSRLAYIGLLTLGVATGIPGTIVIILAGGFAFGVVDATATSSIGLTLGSLILYLASRYAFGPGSRQPPPLVARLHQGFERYPASYTLFLRFIPVLPFGAVTVALAWLRCPLWLFLGASWLGGTVSLVFETSIGAGLGDAMREGDSFGIGMLLHREVLLPLGAVVVLALVALLVKRLGARRRGRDTIE